MARTAADDPIMVQARKQLLQAAAQRPVLRQVYANEPKVSIYLSPMYRPYFGRVMGVTIQGVKIWMPVDGSTHDVPQSFADEITRRRMSVDAQLTKQNRMSDIRGNFENAPGELKLF
jgi:hypothetical protein